MSFMHSFLSLHLFLYFVQLGIQRLYDTATLHTVFGDIQVALFKECQKTVENFCVHSKNGYYNGNIFHRVIKGFMIQTGDPTGMQQMFNLIF